MKPRALPRWLSSPTVQISFLGVLSWLAYLHLATTYPLADYVAKFTLTDFGRANNWHSVVGIDFILSTFGALLFCLLAWLIANRHPRNKKALWLIIGFAFLFACTLLVMYPIGATDIFEYVFHSRILVRYGQNPFTVPPSVFNGDPFLTRIPWARHPSPYGPLWALLTVPGSLLAGNDFLLALFLMKGLAIPFYLGSVLLIAAILQHLHSDYKLAGTLLFAWNPLVLFEIPGNGHNGIMMMFLALLATYLMVRRQWTWVIPVLVASVLIKWVTAILLIPFLIYCWHAQPDSRARWMYLAKTSLIAALMVILAALPFLAIPTGLLEEANFYSLLALPSLAYHILLGTYGDKIAKGLTIGTGVLTYLGLYAMALRSLWRNLNPRHLVLLNVFLIVAYLGIANMHFQPWFVIWPIALGIWIHHPVVRPVLIVFTGSALFSYVANFWWIWNYRIWGVLQVNLIFVLVIFLPPILIGVLSHLPTMRLQYRKMIEHRAVD